MKQSFRQFVKYFVLIPFLTTLCCLDPFQVNPTRAENHSTEFEFCWSVLDAFFIFQESLPTDPYQYQTPKELYASVNERYTSYASPTEAVNLRQSLTTEQSGRVGITVDSCAIGYVITRVILNSPALRSGLQKNDTMTAIDDSSLAQRAWKSNAEFLFKGNIGDLRRLTIKRSDSIFTTTVTLGTFLAPTVYCDSLDSVTAIISLKGFLLITELPGGSAEEMDSALKQMAWAPNLIIDLRSNGGGYLSQCYNITSHFVPINTTIIRSRERFYDTLTDIISTVDTVLRTTIAGDALLAKIFILTDHYTASASEIFVSCLKENRPQVTTIGQTTYGKARALIMYPTPENGYAIVTYSLMTPLQMPPYDLVGILPDVAVPDSIDEIAVALNLIHGAAAMAKRSAGVQAAHSSFPKIPYGDSWQNTLPLLIRD